MGQKTQPTAQIQIQIQSTEGSATGRWRFGICDPPAARIYIFSHLFFFFAIPVLDRQFSVSY